MQPDSEALEQRERAIQCVRGVPAHLTTGRQQRRPDAPQKAAFVMMFVHSLPERPAQGAASLKFSRCCGRFLTRKGSGRGSNLENRKARKENPIRAIRFILTKLPIHARRLAVSSGSMQVVPADNAVTPKP